MDSCLLAKPEISSFSNIPKRTNAPNSRVQHGYTERIGEATVSLQHLPS